jgi:16S rRNA (guanine966-N2)-methyltransferase
VFNSLDSRGLLDGVVVADLFAGSGALGIEALSRGASRCTFVERDRAAVVALRANIDALDLNDRGTVVVTDVLAWVPAMRNVDVVFADPPYEFDGWDRLLSLIDAPTLIAESGRAIAPPPDWEVIRSKRYGRTWVTSLERVT